MTTDISPRTHTLHLHGDIPGGAIRPTPRALAVAALFGLSLEPRPRTLFPDFSLPLSPGDLLLITGSSGAGKSTLLRRLVNALPPDLLPVQNLADIPLPNDRPVVDCFDHPLDETLAHLARAGLSEAPLLLRAPAELSEGQAFRYRLAHFFAGTARTLVADEFAATLDRVTARVVSFQLAKFIRRSRTTPHPRLALLATTHEDLLQDLHPTRHIWKGLGQEIHLTPSP